MSAGELRQIGTPDEIYDSPADRFVAEFIGSPPMNLIPGEVRNGQVFALDGWQLSTPRPVEAVSGPVDIGLRPEAIVLSESAAGVGQPATVFLVEPLGSETILYVTIGETTLRVRVAPYVRPEIGSTVWLQAVATGVRLFDRGSGKAINR
jgi:ABC-type sugar transport system ATPase subunit